MVEAMDLSRNPGISDAAGRKLLQAIKSRHHVHTLHLHGTGISAKVMGMIQQQLDLNAFKCGITELEVKNPQQSARWSLLYITHLPVADC